MVVAVASVTLVTRLAYGAKGPTDWDSVQYLSGLSTFDVTHDSPHPPGYWLYVKTGWVLHQLGLSPVGSLVLVAAAASAAAAAATYLLAAELLPRWLAVGAAALVASAPTAWFAGSMVGTYSCDLVAGALLALLALRARPGSGHGVAAAVVFALGIGFRQSMAEMFLPVTAIAVAASTRGLRRLGATVAAFVAAMAVWMVPMAVQQPGGLGAWWRASRAQTNGALHTTSIFYAGAAGTTNLNTFAAYTLLSLGVAAVVGIVAILLGPFGSRRRAAPAGSGPMGSGPAGSGPAGSGPAGSGPAGSGPAEVASGPVANRPWFQRPVVVLLAALVPGAAIDALVQFAKGGYVLAYLAPATVLLLLPAGWALARAGRVVKTALVVAAAGIVAVGTLFNADRFVRAPGILPLSVMRNHPGWWISNARYQAPYPDTVSAIRHADAVDAQLARTRSLADPARDVIVYVATPFAANYYRNLDWAAPAERADLVDQSIGLIYQEQRGLLYYASGHQVSVGPGGHALLLVSIPDAGNPALSALAGRGLASPLPAGTINGYRVWRVDPGATLFGVTVRVQQGARPLGASIIG